jgi:hypothetical protein
MLHHSGGCKHFGKIILLIGATPSLGHGLNPMVQFQLFAPNSITFSNHD